MKAETLELLKMANERKEAERPGLRPNSKSVATIADLAGSETITSEHVMEAIQFRALNQQIWT